MRPVLLCTLLFLTVNLFTHEEDISGYWHHTEDKGTSVSKVYRRGNTYEAFCFMYTNAGVAQENDRGNPNKEKRGRSMEGVIFLYKLLPHKEKGETIWTEGRLYNPRDGNEYRAKAFLTDGGNTLNIRVSVDKLGGLGVTLQWKRAVDPADITRYDTLASAVKPVYALE